MALDYTTTIVSIFIFLLLVYIVIFYNNLKQHDVILLLLAIVALFWTYTKTGAKYVEGFKNDKKTQLKEDYSPIAQSLVQYFTIYDDSSYKEGKQVWQGIVKNKKQPDCDTRLIFSKTPTFFLQNGISLGDNIVTGPLSNTLGIKFGKPFTICLAFTFGQLTWADDGNIELIKTYANTSNNNGFTLYIPRSSINTTGGANFGSLFFQFADNTPLACTLGTKEQKTNFPINTLCFLIIVRTNDKVRILYMNEKEDKINELASLPLSATDATFSNKECNINSQGNWNANLINIAMYDNNLDDIAVLKYYMYVKELYTKYNNPAYLETLAKLQEAQDKADALRACPFPIPVCKSCSTIKDWSNMNDILNAPQLCKKEIGNFCSKNPQHEFCYCWDKSNPKYDSQTCQLMRAMFLGNTSSLCQSVCNVTPPESASVGVDDFTFDRIKIPQATMQDTMQELLQGTTDSPTRQLLTRGDKSKTYQNDEKPLTFWQRLVNAFTW